jgi:MFS family permease
MMRSVVYVLIFLLTLHSTLTLYTNSSYLSTVVHPELLGTVYIIAALLSLLVLLYGHRLGAIIGNLRLAICAGLLEVVALLGLTMTDTPWLVVLSFCFTQASIALLFYTFDVFLESYTKNSSTGGVRGVYLTVINAAFLLGPLVGTQLLGTWEYAGVYYLAACVMLLVTLATAVLLHRFEDPHYVQAPAELSLAAFRKKPAIAYITLSFAALSMFYAIWTIYMPLYFLQTLEFSVEVFGYLMLIILIPFVLVQVPLGKLADKAFGEKEFLVIGFALMTVTSFLLPFTVVLGFAALVAIIFIGRIGAASSEVMADAYFFKHVSARNNGAITTYRSMTYVAYIVVPILVGPLFVQYGFALASPIAGIFALCGLLAGSMIKDTK